MTNEEKQLLLKDLCARLPYRVMIKSVGENKIIGLWDLKDVDNLPLPYLRPMSSMTEEELLAYDKTREWKYVDDDHYEHFDTLDTFDWLNAHHFDYRRLIEKGLALKAPNGMYKF